MSPQELAGFASAIAQLIDDATATLRREQAEAIEGVQRSHVASLAEVSERCQRAELRADQLQRDLDAAVERAAQPAILDMTVDASGYMHTVQRDGTKISVRLSDESQRIADAVDERGSAAESRITAHVDAHVARSLQVLGLAPNWSRLAAYAAGAVVTCYVGRTYRLRDGVRASMGQEPGEHADVWERLGSHGLRVLKSKPATLQAGDVFTEGDAKFFHDGVNTVLFVPKAIKHSEVERAIRSEHAHSQALVDGVRAELRELAGVVRSTAQAANDAQGWIEREGDAAVIRSAETQAWCANRALLIDSPALARIVERADDLDDLLDQGAA